VDKSIWPGVATSLLCWCSSSPDEARKGKKLPRNIREDLSRCRGPVRTLSAAFSLVSFERRWKARLGGTDEGTVLSLCCEAGGSRGSRSSEGEA
jgi:hypothetical protein